MPGTLRNASRNVVTPCGSITARGITWMLCGVSLTGRT